jgi:hypothetical protein
MNTLFAILFWTTMFIMPVIINYFLNDKKEKFDLESFKISINNFFDTLENDHVFINVKNNDNGSEKHYYIPYKLVFLIIWFMLCCAGYNSWVPSVPSTYYDF